MQSLEILNERRQSITPQFKVIPRRTGRALHRRIETLIHEAEKFVTSKAPTVPAAIHPAGRTAKERSHSAPALRHTSPNIFSRSITEQWTHPISN